MRGLQSCPVCEAAILWLNLMAPFVDRAKKQHRKENSAMTTIQTALLNISMVKEIAKKHHCTFQNVRDRN
jgi:hypothetical protein